MSTEVTGEITVRVRYAETDAMGTVHHANYFVYFEQARTDLLRSRGISYRQVEEMGFLLVLTRVAVRLLKPARYDDDLCVRTTVRLGGAYQCSLLAAQRMILCQSATAIDSSSASTASLAIGSEFRGRSTQRDPSAGPSRWLAITSASMVLNSVAPSMWRWQVSMKSQ